MSDRAEHPFLNMWRETRATRARVHTHAHEFGGTFQAFSAAMFRDRRTLWRVVPSSKLAMPHAIAGGGILKNRGRC